MGHSIHYLTYPEKINKREVIADCKEIFRNEGGEYGLSEVEYKSRTFDSYDEAVEYIEQNYCGDYEQVAFKYKEPTEPPKSQVYQKLLAQQKELKERYYAMERKVHFSSDNVKSSFIACKKCGSKLASNYIRSNNCPLCGNDLRPPTTINNIKRIKEKLEDVSDKIKRIELEHSKKSKNIRWIVKIEFHV